MSKRIEWVDVAKGIGICLVVIAHFVPDFSTLFTETIYHVIYMFHMPLFFFLGGYVFKKQKDNLQNTIYNFFQLIIPYYAYFLAIPLLRKGNQTR